MKCKKLFFICLSALLILTTGCNATNGKNTTSSGAGSAAKNLSSESSSSGSPETSSTQSAFSQSVSQASSREQTDSEWIAYDTNKDGYKLHIKKADGSEDKVIVDDIVLAPCVAGEWVYYIYPLQEIDKVKLDGSQKTKVCDVNAMKALNANVAVTAEYKDGYILYKLVQLREVGDDRPNTVTYYKLDLDTNEITEVKN